MIGIILAAGIGSRLRPLTDTLPKCLVNVHGIPILQYQLDAFKTAGINKLVVATGYLSEKVKAYLDERLNTFFDFSIVENKKFSTTNNMYSLWLTKNIVNDDVILTNGDVIYDPWILHSLCSTKQENSIAVDTGVYIDENMKIEVNNGNVVRISKTISRDCSYATSIDLYRLNKNAILKLFDLIEDKYIKKNIINQWTEVALQDLFMYDSFTPFDIRGRRWIEIDTLSDLETAERLFGGLDEKNL